MAVWPVVHRSKVLARAVSSILGGSLGAQSQPRSLLSAASRRAFSVYRSPSVCGGLLSVMPLHNAVASARLRSAIAPESQSWGLVPQESIIFGMVSSGSSIVLVPEVWTLQTSEYSGQTWISSECCEFVGAEVGLNPGHN